VLALARSHSRHIRHALPTPGAPVEGLKSDTSLNLLVLSHPRLASPTASARSHRLSTGVLCGKEVAVGNTLIQLVPPPPL